MRFANDFHSWLRENDWQIASLVTPKLLFTVTHPLFFISWPFQRGSIVLHTSLQWLRQTIQPTKNTPYLALVGELWGVFCEESCKTDCVITALHCVHAIDTHRSMKYDDHDNDNEMMIQHRNVKQPIHLRSGIRCGDYYKSKNHYFTSINNTVWW